MKKLAFIFAIFITNFSFSQHDIANELLNEYQLIESKSGYVPNTNWTKIPLMDSLFHESILLKDLYIDQPQLDIVSVSIHSGQSFKNENFLTYFNKFNFKKYLDTTKFLIKFEIINVVVCSSMNPDDLNFFMTNVGYQESILIKNKLTGNAELLIDVFYLNQSSYIRGVNVFMADRLFAY